MRYIWGFIEGIEGTHQNELAHNWAKWMHAQSCAKCHDRAQMCVFQRLRMGAHRRGRARIDVGTLRTPVHLVPSDNFKLRRCTTTSHHLGKAGSEGSNTPDKTMLRLVPRLVCVLKVGGGGGGWRLVWEKIGLRYIKGTNSFAPWRKRRRWWSLWKEREEGMGWGEGGDVEKRRLGLVSLYDVLPTYSNSPTFHLNNTACAPLHSQGPVVIDNYLPKTTALFMLCSRLTCYGGSFPRCEGV